MKQMGPDIHACTMDSVILMKGFEFICPLSKRLFVYVILFNFFLCFAVKNNLMDVSRFKMFVPDV
jgi:hypothetical protein